MHLLQKYLGTDTLKELFGLIALLKNCALTHCYATNTSNYKIHNSVLWYKNQEINI